MSNEPTIKDTTDSRTIDKDELVEVARNAECLDMLMADMLQDFFDSHHPEKGRQESTMLAWDFKRYRLYANVCFELAHKIMTDLHRCGIDCYGDC